MELSDIGEIIAVRKLSVEDDSDEAKFVTIKIGKPEMFLDSTDYFTPFQIEGLGTEKILYAAGIDAVQSLQLVMRMIGAKLDSLRSSISSRVFWEGDEGGDLGFPIENE